MNKDKMLESDFEAWLRAADRALIRIVGVGYRDLREWAWRAAYDQNLTPHQAALAAIAEVY